jgi:hypothetical protein
MSEVSVVDLLFRQLWDHAVIDEHGSTRDWTQDTQDLAESLHGCCIFLDNTGSLGIVPAAAQEGDTVCIVAGTTNYTAVLLQKRTEGD